MFISKDEENHLEQNRDMRTGDAHFLAASILSSAAGLLG